MRYAVLVGMGGLLGLACCHAHPAADDAAPAPDTARSDARGPDAPPDAPDDASPDAAPDLSPACTTAPARLLDTSPRVIDSIAIAGGVLYVAAYQQDASGTISNPEVLAVDPSTGMQVAAPLSTTAGAPHVGAAGATAYATEGCSGGSIWRLAAGQRPVEVVTGRPTPGVVAADDTHVYCAEQGTTPADTDVQFYRCFGISEPASMERAVSPAS